MAEFDRDYIDLFLGVIRKYMQLNGNISQKDLAELTEVGVSTMSRFLNQKTTEVNPQLVAKIVAKLEIPLHEIIDFVDEGYNDKFIRLVKFYKGDKRDEKRSDDTLAGVNVAGDRLTDQFGEHAGTLGTASKGAKARVNIGGGKKGTIYFEGDGNAKNSDLSIKEKLEQLSPRQKAYLTDFLNLDPEGKDLIVDLGNALLRYFRQKGLE